MHTLAHGHALECAQGHVCRRVREFYVHTLVHGHALECALVQIYAWPNTWPCDGMCTASSSGLALIMSMHTLLHRRVLAYMREFFEYGFRHGRVIFQSHKTAEI